MDMLLLGRRLRAVRIATGFDDADHFARLLHFTPRIYRKAEAGTASAADLLEILVEVGRVAGHSLDFLVRGRNFEVGNR